MEVTSVTEYPSIEKPWRKYYAEESTIETYPQMTLYEYLHTNNEDYMNQIAINYYDNKITFGKLFEKIELAEKSFFALGVKQNDVVALCTVNIPETIYSIYALNHIGAIVNLIDPRSPLETIDRFLLEGESNTLVCIDKIYPHIQGVINRRNISNVIVVSPSDSLTPIKTLAYKLKNKKIISEGAYSWNQFIALGQKEGIKPYYPNYEREKCVIMAHTGGTTGIPKTVMLSADNINSVAFSYKYTGIPFERGQRFFNDLPPFIIYGLVIGLHTILCNGMEVITYPIFDSVRFPVVFRKYRPNHFSALSGHLKYLIEDANIKKMSLDFLITAAVGGDSLNENLERETNKFFENHGCEYMVCKGYGMSELAGTALTSSKMANAIGSVGIPLLFNNIKIVDTDTGSELGYNCIGELWIMGPSIMLGYLNDKEATDERISYDETGARWLHTGDLAYVDRDGLVYIKGRLRRMYLSVMDGQPAKIFPYVIETEISKHKAVVEACAIGRLKENSTYYEMYVYVVSNDKERENEIRKELFELVHTNVPSKMQPKEIIFIDELPKTTNGKVDFMKLERLEL